jgi:hypothetical protein
MLELDTRILSAPEGRRVGQPGHDAAMEYLRNRMESIGLSYLSGDDYCLRYEAHDPVSGMKRKFTNLAGVIPGNDDTAMPILLGAHYDSAVDGPSSDDNAVSIAVLLRAAEILIQKGTERRVIFAFFDAEEAPYFLTESMGSIRFYNDCCRELDFACVIIMDMIGHDFQIGIPLLDTVFHRIREMIFVLGSESHSSLPAIVEGAGSSIDGLRIIPTLNRYVGDTSDHYIFRKAGQPFLFISRGRGMYSHTLRDTPEWINFTAAAEVLEFLLSILESLDSSIMETGRDRIDPFRFEIRMIRKAIGWPLPLLMGYLGFYKLSISSRKELDSLAGKLAGLFRF